MDSSEGGIRRSAARIADVIFEKEAVRIVAIQQAVCDPEKVSS